MGKHNNRPKRSRSSANSLGVSAAIQQGLSEQPTLSASDVLPVVNKVIHEKKKEKPVSKIK
jgi:hypothetical protein